MLMSFYILNKRGKSLSFSTIKSTSNINKNKKTRAKFGHYQINESLIYYRKKYSCPVIKPGYGTKSKSRKRTKHSQSGILSNNSRVCESGWLAERDTTQTD